MRTVTMLLAMTGILALPRPALAEQTAQACHFLAFHGDTNFIANFKNYRLANAQPNSWPRGQDGKTVLHYALLGGQLDMVRKLLKHARDRMKELVRTPDTNGVTPVFDLLQHRRWDSRTLPLLKTLCGDNEVWGLEKPSSLNKDAVAAMLNDRYLSYNCYEYVLNRSNNLCATNENLAVEAHVATNVLSYVVGQGGETNGWKFNAIIDNITVVDNNGANRSAYLTLLAMLDGKVTPLVGNTNVYKLEFTIAGKSGSKTSGQSGARVHIQPHQRHLTLLAQVWDPDNVGNMELARNGVISTTPVQRSGISEPWLLELSREELWEATRKPGGGDYVQRNLPDRGKGLWIPFEPDSSVGWSDRVFLNPDMSRPNTRRLIWRVPRLDQTKTKGCKFRAPSSKTGGGLGEGMATSSGLPLSVVWAIAFTEERPR